MPLFDFFRRPANAPPAPHDARKAQWQRTALVQHRLHDTPGYRPPDASAPYGYYEGRYIIGSGMSRVIDGVYLGAGAREAVVVKETFQDASGYECEGLLPKAYLSFMERRYTRCQQEEAVFRHGILRAAFEEVSRLLRFDEDAVKALTEQALRHRPDQKVSLDQFVLGGFGVCRHQALLMAYFLEKLCQQPDVAYGIRGTFSLERNEVATPSQQIGAHAWVRFTSTTSGRVYIFDVAQGVCADLKDLIGDPSKWIYARPEELVTHKNGR